MALLLIRAVAHVYMALSVVRPLQTMEISSQFFQLISTEYRTVGLARSKRKLASQAWRHTGLFCLLSARFSVLIFLLFARAILEEVKYYRISTQSSLPVSKTPQKPTNELPTTPTTSTTSNTTIKSMPAHTPTPTPTPTFNIVPEHKELPEKSKPKSDQTMIKEIICLPKKAPIKPSWPTGAKQTSAPPTPPAEKEEDIECESLIVSDSNNITFSHIKSTNIHQSDDIELSQRYAPTPPPQSIEEPKVASSKNEINDTTVAQLSAPTDLSLFPVSEETEEELFTEDRIVSIEPTKSPTMVYPTHEPTMAVPKKLISPSQQPSQSASSSPLPLPLPLPNFSLSTPVPVQSPAYSSEPNMPRVSPPTTETVTNRPPVEHRHSHSSTSFDSQPSTKSGKSIKSRLQTALQKASRVAAKDISPTNVEPSKSKSSVTRAASKSSKRFSNLADIPIPTSKPSTETKDTPKKSGNRFTKIFRKKK
ncbi:hypothetical protein J3Q64DRAFT_1759265 [Phycomyces blakesleeanus]|uniref:Uncharacterized protein n=1 Tax=Phycomyces blakesleeanus TaxID=4837 RepID=A0ABR3AQI8_PHYBL